MANTISNTDDTIDSRNIIERLEELEALRKPWVAGCNMPGYMPDSEPARFETWDEARDAIVSDLEEALELAAYDENGNLLAGDASEEAKELEGAIEHLKEHIAEGVEYGETIGSWHYWIAHSDGDDAFEELEDAQEYRALKALADEAADYAPDWAYGAQLIRDSYFVTAMQELCDEIGDFPNGVPSYYVIDWEATARNLRVDYTEVDFDGVTYWVR
jgi:hypothetical protein